jgi:UDP-N-acetylglucosamine transferase subunit ALG13
MIFVTVGTHHDPFDRLLEALRALPGEDLVVQHGNGEPPPAVREAVPFMSYDEILRNMREAEVVITHAGVGSILCARRQGHKPIVVPRLREEGEHVDDHQGELAAALHDRGEVISVWDVDLLADALDEVPRLGAPRAQESGSLHVAVREALRLGAGRL